MNKIGKAIGLCFCLFLVIVCQSVASVSVPFGGDFSPVSPPAKSGPLQLKLQILPSGCDQIDLTVSTTGRLVYIGEKTITLRSHGADTLETVLQVSVEPDDTSSIQVDIHGCNLRNEAILYFVSTNDTLRYWKGIPNNYQERAAGQHSVRVDGVPRPLQLDSTLYEYILDLRVKASLKFVKSLPIELTPTEQENIFTDWLTRDQFRKLNNEVVNGRMVEGQLDDSLPPPVDSIPPDSATDTLKTQGALESPDGPRGSGAFSLAGVDGLSGGKLPTNQLITFFLHIDNNTYHDVDGMTNGFRVYSPDGATWSGTVGDTPPV